MTRKASPKQLAALEQGRGKAGTKKATAKSTAVRKRDQELAESGSPDEVLIEMFRQAGIAATRGLRRFNSKGGEPSRQTIDAVKEARQLALTAREILIERGHAGTVDTFLAEVTERVSNANLGPCPHCGEPPIKPVTTGA